MPARSAWKGYLQVSQLQIPVKAFTAVSTRPEIPLNQLHRDCCQRIRQQKCCPDHGLLEEADIVAGYEYATGQFLPLPPDDLEALQPDDTKAIAVDAFVEVDHVDPVYHSGRTYYLVPDAPPAQRPFCVLRDGMKSVSRHAVARVVIGGRQLLVLLRPMSRLLAMTVLEFPQRVRPASDYEGDVAQITTGSQEQELIEKLIRALSATQVDLAKYRDEYTDRLNELIEMRLAQLTFAEPHTTDETPYDESELIAALRMSLAESQGKPMVHNDPHATSPDAEEEIGRMTG